MFFVLISYSELLIIFSLILYLFYIKNTRLSMNSVLNILLLRNNRISGNLDDKFNPEFNLNLTMIDLIQNELTGTIPNTLYQLPKLQSLFLSKNCLTDKLSNAICSSNSLTFLALNSLRGNER